jgi:hypothetical protein
MAKEIQERGAWRGGCAVILFFCMQTPPALIAGRQFNILWEKGFNEGNR